MSQSQFVVTPVDVDLLKNPKTTLFEHLGVSKERVHELEKVMYEVFFGKILDTNCDAIDVTDLLIAVGNEAKNINEYTAGVYLSRGVGDHIKAMPTFLIPMLSQKGKEELVKNLREGLDRARNGCDACNAVEYVKEFLRQAGL